MRYGKSIGGAGEDVEIDEFMVAKLKYNRGGVLEGQIWVLCGIIRKSQSNASLKLLKREIEEHYLKLLAKNKARYKNL